MADEQPEFEPWPEDWPTEAPYDEFEAEVFASVPVSAPPSDGDGETPSPTRVMLRKASSIAIKGVRWLYQGRIPLGMVTLLAGREGIGKSTVSLDIAARLTRGELEGKYLGQAQSVVICATEDSWAHTIVPRLIAVGADLEKVFHIAVQDEDGRERAIVAPQDIREMRKAFSLVRPALMLIDPLMAIIDGRVDTHKQAEVQQALEPLVKLCADLDVSVLALIHVNKSNGTDPLNNIMGSKAFATLPRSILYCIEEEEGEYLLCHVKCNVGPRVESVGYHIQTAMIPLPEDQVEDGITHVQSSRVVWGEVTSRTAGDVLEEKQKVGPNLGDNSREILDLIESINGPVTAQDLKSKLDMDEATINRITSRLVQRKKLDRLSRGVFISIKPAS